MPAAMSVIIPAHNEEAYLPRCLRSVRLAEARLAEPVEIVVVLNRCTDRTESIAREFGAKIVSEPAKNLARIRNTGVAASQGRIVVTIDADSWMSPNMLCEVSRKLATGRYIGGGVRVKAERMSLGIFLSAMTFLPKLILARCWVGMFWMPREAFEAVGGFNHEFLSAEDVDLAHRLRAYGRSQGRRYGLILRAYMGTSCRKFDQFGDWYLLRNRDLVVRLLGGRDREAADLFYYDVRTEPEGESSHPPEDAAASPAMPEGRAWNPILGENHMPAGEGLNAKVPRTNKPED